MNGWSVDITKWVAKTKVDAQLALQRIALEALKRVILRSPVDTGRFRANWGVRIGSPYSTVDDAARDKIGQATIARASPILDSWDGKGSAFIGNGLPYGPKLEYGGSKQAPNGMVRLTVVEIKEWIRTQR